jgi:hypothetical protein
VSDREVLMSIDRQLLRPLGVAHVIGAFIGLVGGYGVLYGVGLPVAIVLLPRVTPSSGLRIEASGPHLTV